MSTAPSNEFFPARARCQTIDMVSRLTNIAFFSGFCFPQNLKEDFMRTGNGNRETKKQRNKETKKQRNKETKKQRKKETKKQRNKDKIDRKKKYKIERQKGWRDGEMGRWKEKKWKDGKKKNGKKDKMESVYLWPRPCHQLIKRRQELRFLWLLCFLRLLCFVRFRLSVGLRLIETYV